MARAPHQPRPGPGRGPSEPRAHARQPDPDRLQRHAQQQPVRAQAADLQRQPPGTEPRARGQDAWGRDQILARADELADRAIAIWPSPLPGVAEHASAASTGAGSTLQSPPSRAAAGRPTASWPSSAAPPPCQWASTWLIRSRLDNAYRVLGSDGKPRPDFRWNNPGDARDRRKCSGMMVSASTPGCRRPRAADHRRGTILADRGARRRRASKLRRPLAELVRTAGVGLGPLRCRTRAAR